MGAALKGLGVWAIRQVCRLCPWLDGPRLLSVRIGYEKAGLSIFDEPVPWNADVALLEAQVWFPARKFNGKSDFFLDIPGEAPILASSERALDEQGETLSLQFRLHAPSRATHANLYWRSNLLEQVTVPFLSREDFLRNLRIEAPTLFAHLAGQQVPCQVLVDGQSRGLTAAALLKSPTSLAPLLDLKPVLVFTLHHPWHSSVVSIPWTSAALRARQALVSVRLPHGESFEGNATVRWTVAGQVYAEKRLRTISPWQLQQSLYVADSRYVSCDPCGGMSYTRHLFPADPVRRLGPCFLVCSHEEGLAAVQTLQVKARYKESNMPLESIEQEAIITDGPLVFVPLTTTPEQFQKYSSFELCSEGKRLALLSLCTRAVASFTNEGGFSQPKDYPWTPLAEEELEDHLRKLMEVPQAP